MQNLSMKQVVAAVSSTLLIGVALVAQSGQTPAGGNDWPMFSRDFSGSRFSPLADINTGNVAQLAQAWSVQLTQPAGRRGGGPAPATEESAQGRGAATGGRAGAAGRGAAAGEEESVGSNPEVTPIVVSGVMYPARARQPGAGARR